jgi:hypothetical protein
MRRLRYGWALWLLALFLVQSTTFARAESLVAQTVTKVRLEDREISIPYRVFLEDPRDDGVLRLRAVGDLAELRKALPVVLQKFVQSKSQECSNRFDLTELVLAPAAPNLQARGNLRYELWGCAKLGGSRMKRKLLSQQGKIALTLATDVADKSVGLTVLRSEIDLRGPAGQLVKQLGVGDRLRDELKRALNRALNRDQARLVLPAEFREMDIRFTAARFVALPEGNVGVEIAGSAKVGSDVLLAIYNKFLRR